MIFADLYHLADALPEPPVGFDFLRDRVVALHPTIGRVDVFSVAYSPSNSQAHFRLGESDRSSPYEEEFQVAEIRHCDALALDQSEYRFALTKELMHVFDSPEEQTNTAERFRKLLHEIQNEPLAQHASAMYQSEINTRWMALLVLCPKTARDRYVDDFRAGKLAEFDIAAVFEIPEWTAEAVMDEYYDTVYETFVNGNGR